MEQDRRITYTVKHPGRLAVILVVSVGIILLAFAWTLYLVRANRRIVDLTAYTTVTRTGETVTAVLDVDSLLTELGLPNPRTEPKAAQNGAVKALVNMEMALAFTEEPDVVDVSVKVNTTALRLKGIRVDKTQWLSPVKVLPRTETPVQEAAPETPAEVEHPKTVLADGLISSLLDEEGKGLNLSAVCERVHFERDRLGKEIFGNDFGTIKTHLWFIVYPEGGEHRNAYRAVYTLYERTPSEVRSIHETFFRVDVLDLAYQAGTGVSFRRSDVSMYDTEAEALGAEEVAAQGGTVIELIGGSVQGEARPSFDYNGFVRCVGLPMSHPLPDGSLWSPSYDPLDEDDLWRLVGNGEYTMVELLNYVSMEIYARHGYTFPAEDMAIYREHFAACPWYAATESSPERFMTATERQNLDLLRHMRSLLES